MPTVNTTVTHTGVCSEQKFFLSKFRLCYALLSKRIPCQAWFAICIVTETCSMVFKFKMCPPVKLFPHFFLPSSCTKQLPFCTIWVVNPLHFAPVHINSQVYYSYRGTTFMTTVIFKQSIFHCQFYQTKFCLHN